MKKQKTNKLKLEHWIKAVLSNDEYSSDEEIVTYFMQEGELTSEEAQAWVAKRDFYRNNIVMNDGTVYDPRTGHAKLK